MCVSVCVCVCVMKTYTDAACPGERQMFHFMLNMRMCISGLQMEKQSLEPRRCWHARCKCECVRVRAEQHSTRSILQFHWLKNRRNGSLLSSSDLSGTVFRGCRGRLGSPDIADVRGSSRRRALPACPGLVSPPALPRVFPRSLIGLLQHLPVGISP